MTMKQLLYSIFVFTFLLASCTPDEDPFTPVPKDEKTFQLNESLQPKIKQDNTFAVDLFKEIYKNAKKDNKENVFISPLSISMALSMTLNGADGQTREDMEAALRISGFSADQINDYCKTLREGLISIDPQTEVAIANSIWYRNGFPVEKTFLELNKSYFDAEVNEADFSPNTVTRINNWCALHTNDKIKEILQEIPTEAMMYLINAVYFNGIWQYKFNKDDSSGGYFFGEDEAQEVTMMKQKNEFDYAEDGVARYLVLPYGNGSFNMVVMLPKNGKTTDDVVDNLNPDYWTTAVSKKEMKLKFPRFKVECEYKLKDVLSDMGMGLAFTNAADFSKISSNSRLAISEVVHKTFVEVTEDGTEAAAVTLVEMANTSVIEDKSLYEVNKPFVFAIQEKSTGVILFMGKIGKV